MSRIYKLSVLLKQDQKLFHTQDLAVLWSSTNKNSLYTAINRFIKKGILCSIQKGLYSTLPLQNLDPKLLGSKLIHSYTYLSTESVLAESGVISQKVYPLTFVAASSKKINLAGNSYLYRQMKPAYLFQVAGIVEIDGVLVASPERAVSDMSYFNPKYNFDNPSIINWDRVKEITSKVGYKK